MSETDHKHWQDEVAAYLLGALEPGESAALERHVAGCADCQADLEQLRPAIDLLPASVEMVDPPARLRTEILDQVRSEAKHSASSDPEPRRRRFAGWRPVAGLAAAALLVVVAAGYAISGDSGGDSATTVVAGKPPAVTAKLVMEGDSGTLRLANVGEMPEHKVLEAWVQRDGEVMPVKRLFVPDREGRATTTIPDMNGVEVVMVTSEPLGGSESPTGAPLVTAKIETD